MSFEIELKAHVYNRKEVIEKLNSVAQYLGHTYKKDTYYHLPQNITVRLRNQIEDTFMQNQTVSKTNNYFTYKKKETKVCENGTEIEVNIENETLVENPAALEQLFFDLGGKIAYTKEKDVEHWNYTTQNETLHAELCTVPPLGDFLEIEIIKEVQDEQTVQKITKLQEQLLSDCNIPLSQIEPKYYSQMLKEIQNLNK